MGDNHQNNIATFIHLSTFSRFIIPLGNFLGPIILWVANKDKSSFVDEHGKQAINFQISILLYKLLKYQCEKSAFRSLRHNLSLLQLTFL